MSIFWGVGGDGGRTRIYWKVIKSIVILSAVASLIGRPLKKKKLLCTVLQDDHDFHCFPVHLPTNNTAGITETLLWGENCWGDKRRQPPGKSAHWVAEFHMIMLRYWFFLTGLCLFFWGGGGGGRDKKHIAQCTKMKMKKEQKKNCSHKKNHHIVMFVYPPTHTLYKLTDITKVDSPPPPPPTPSPY